MAAEKRIEGHRPAPAKITLSLADLSASLDTFLVQPQTERGRVVAAEDTVDINCTDGATCNAKCGPTAYWECGTSPAGGCVDSAEYPYCVTYFGSIDPFC